MSTEMSANEMLDHVVVSLKMYPHGGGDVRVMAEVDRIVREALAASEPGEASIGEAAEILDDILINEACGCAQGKYPHPCPRCKVTLDEAREFLTRIGYQGYVEPPTTAHRDSGDVAGEHTRAIQARNDAVSLRDSIGVEAAGCRPGSGQEQLLSWVQRVDEIVMALNVIVAAGIAAGGAQPCDQCMELERTFELIHDADMRGIAMWREAHPGNELVQPDRAKMIFWLLEKLGPRVGLNREKEG